MNGVVAPASRGRFVTAPSTCPRDGWRRSSARTAPARRRRSTCWSGCCHRRAARRKSPARSPTTRSAFWRGLVLSARRAAISRPLSDGSPTHGKASQPDLARRLARDRLLAAEVPLDRPASRLSGGQRAQLPLLRSRSGRNRTCSSSTSHWPAWIRSPDETSCGPHVDQRDRYERHVVVASHQRPGTRVRLLIVIVSGRLRLVGDIDDLFAKHRWIIAQPTMPLASQTAFTS